MTRYMEPTTQQAEEAAALLFLAETQKALHHKHIWDLKLEVDVTYGFHNQRIYRVHATTATGETITGDNGYYVHPANGTPETTAWSLSMTARSATAKRRQDAEAATEPAPAEPHRKTA
jgi:hypothetical protein